MPGDIPTMFIFANTNHLFIFLRLLVLVEKLLEGFLVFGVVVLLGFMDVRCHPFPFGQA
tara:strand:- start:282 stop:458 length:177 start_codon:yes stop_codon:yes gene_type:complete